MQKARENASDSAYLLGDTQLQQLVEANVERENGLERIKHRPDLTGAEKLAGAASLLQRLPIALQHRLQLNHEFGLAARQQLNLRCLCALQVLRTKTEKLHVRSCGMIVHKQTKKPKKT